MDGLARPRSVPVLLGDERLLEDETGIVRIRSLQLLDLLQG